jgi:hypothetical protein
MTPILISAPIANKPFNGGNAWTHLSYVQGFRKLGFDVYFVEKIHPAACVDREGRPASPVESVNRSYFRQVLEEFGLKGKMSLLTPNADVVEGMPFKDLLDVAESSLLLLNVSGHMDIPELVERVRRKVYLDLDPGFTQFWHADSSNGFRVEGHDYYFTIGENIGSRECSIPLGGIPWRRTRQPAVADAWPVCSPPAAPVFTTIATWRGPFGPVTAEGRTFGSKVHEFRKYADIPKRTDATFEIALDIHPADQRDQDLLRENSWRLVDPKEAVPDPSSFRRYVQASGAEFSVAQQIYAATGSGWFSDRTVRYLASGKPALVQETGFTRNVPAGEGLLAFSNKDEAIAGVRNIMSDYSRHAMAARRIAEEYFDSDRVLGELLAQVA